MPLLTASQARELAGPSPQERVESIMPQIRSRALQSKRFVDLDGWWGPAGYQKTQDWNQAADILQGLGYVVEAIYEDSPVPKTITRVKW